MDNQTSKVLRVKYGSKETATELLEADNLSTRRDADNGVIIELFRYHATTEKPVESFRFHLCTQDVKRLRALL